MLPVLSLEDVPYTASFTIKTPHSVWDVDKDPHRLIDLFVDTGINLEKITETRYRPPKDPSIVRTIPIGGPPLDRGTFYIRNTFNLHGVRMPVCPFGGPLPENVRRESFTLHGDGIELTLKDAEGGGVACTASLYGSNQDYHARLRETIPDVLNRFYAGDSERPAL